MAIEDKEPETHSKQAMKRWPDLNVASSPRSAGDKMKLFHADAESNIHPGLLTPGRVVGSKEKSRFRVEESSGFFFDREDFSDCDFSVSFVPEAGGPLPAAPEVYTSVEGDMFSFESNCSEVQSVLPLLNKRRPPMLSIPLEPEFGQLSLENMPGSDDECGDHANKPVSSDNFGACCKKGSRLVLEDAYQALPAFEGNSQLAFFGVYDGHGGRAASQFASNYLSENILASLKTTGSDISLIEKNIKKGYRITDKSFLQTDQAGGTCCVTAIIKDGTVFVANAGDCRAVLSRSGMAEAVTSDHRASRDDERRRIESLGGFVSESLGIFRVQSSLAVTRSIGDHYLKEYVISEPEVFCFPVSDKTEFLILASDGLWDVVTNQEAVDIVKSMSFPESEEDVESGSSSGGSSEHKNSVGSLWASAANFLKEKSHKRNSRSRSKAAMEELYTAPEGLDYACEKLAALAVERGSADDITVLVIALEGYQKP